MPTRTTSWCRTKIRHYTLDVATRMLHYQTQKYPQTKWGIHKCKPCRAYHVIPLPQCPAPHENQAPQ